MFGNHDTRGFFGQFILWLVVSFLLLAWSCKSPEQIHNADAESEELECEPPDPLERPEGNELRISAERLNSNRLRVRVRNVSSRQVYLPYSPAKQETVFVSYLTEKRNKQGEFELQPWEGDHSPGLNSLDAGSDIQFDFFEVDKGEYRLILRYMVDGRLADLLNRQDCLTKIAKGPRRTESASFRAITPVLEITKRIPTPFR